jgi:formyltetrahydrofolate-dependent phosphoribosylglycinamide formyltransferase
VLSVVVLISGGGTNLAALLDEAQHADFPVRVVAVGADREADGLLFAEQHSVPSFTVPLSSFGTREDWGREILRQIQCWRPDVVVLSGFMRLLPAEVVRELSPRLLNTHPAYLPEFPGAHAVRDALEAGVDETGASVIIVDDGVDTGPILAQERVPVLPGDTEDGLHERIKVVERRLLSGVLRGIADGTIRLEEYAG